MNKKLIAVFEKGTNEFQERCDKLISGGYRVVSAGLTQETDVDYSFWWAILAKDN